MSKLIAITGHEGRIGSELVKRGYTPLECDITDFEQVRDTVSKVNPDVIIHCAAITDVGYCEQRGNASKVFKVNVRGTATILENFEGTFIYLSTVHVFNGEKYFDYTEKHKPDPVNGYGYSKWAGEIAADAFAKKLIVLRMSKTFDYESMRQNIFTIKNTDSTELEFTTLLKRSFVYTPHLVEGIGWVAENLPDVKLLNVAGTDTLSYYNFWLQAANVLGLDEKRIIPRKHKIEASPRPFRGGLNVKKAKKLGVPLYSAVDGLKEIKESME